MKTNWKKNNYKKIAPFNFKNIKDKYVLINEVGDFLFLPEKELRFFLEGDLEKDSKTYKELVKKNFVKTELDFKRLINKYYHKKNYIHYGPSLHIVVITLRCNHNCIYCHASARCEKDRFFDMTRETADKVLDIIFQTTNPFVAIEFQGGEPLLNWPVVKYIIDEAPKRSRKAQKDLELRLVTNGSLINREIFNYLLDKKVSLCLSLDGPEELHNKNRPFVSGNKNSHKNVVKWIKEFNEIYSSLKEKGYIWQASTAMTVTRNSLPLWKEIIDEHVALGLERIYLRNLNPFGFSQNSWKEICYSVDDFLEYYRKSMDYIISLNFKNINIQERFSLVFLVKILSDFDLNHMDWRSPCGAAIGQLAYNYNGDVYTCDEGRMLAMMGDEIFKLGTVYKDSYHDIIMSPVSRTLCTASCLDGLAGCSDCIYKPYCGVCPLYNYFEQGNIFAQMANSERCQMAMGVLDYLFEKLQDKDVRKIFEKWVREATTKKE